ncbi:MAG: M48 family metalloprotease [Lachnospiraceae bacterium]|nr:M48 family metalloprotease [Lachnospiraceae bacterium]
MYCVNCGQKLDDHANFCCYCGTKVASFEKKIQSEPILNVETECEQEDTVLEDAFAELEKVTAEEETAVALKENEAEEVAVESNEVIAVESKEITIKEITAPPEGIRQIYFVDFLYRLVKKENIPLCIYLVLNVLIIGGVMCVFFALPVLWGMLAGLLVYIASIAVAVSPVGEMLLRYQTACKKIQNQQVIDRLYPIFSEVYEKARIANPAISKDVRMFMNDEKCPNAFATGRRTICVTAGLLSLPDDQIKAALAHEFGHLSHRDTDRFLVVYIGNTIILLLGRLFQLGVIIFDVIMTIVAVVMNNEDSIFVLLFSKLSRWLTLFVINGLLAIWSRLGLLLTNKTSRENEYLADAFSCQLGFGEGLVTFFEWIQKVEEKPVGLFAALAQDHPDTDKRIARVQNYLAMNR